MIVYFPMSCRILTVGHIRCLKWLRDYKNQQHPLIIVGLLTDKAMKGYKDPIIPFKDRLEIMEVITMGTRDRFDMRCVWVVPQDSLDPSQNIKRYKPVALASGDGFEPCELKAIKRFKLLKINIDLPKKYSSTDIINKCKKL